MKKLLIIFSVMMIFQNGLHSQAKQRKEMLLQIAALKVYMEYAKKGYSAVSKGLNFIGDAKRGEVNLHGDYFASLLKINPKIRNYYKTAEILSMQIKIIKIYKKTCSTLNNTDLFHGNELDYIERTFERLLESCGDTLDQLLAVTTDSRLELKDDQRITRIDELHKTMLDDLDFCTSFSTEAEQLMLSKASNKNDSENVKDVYGLN